MAAGWLDSFKGQHVTVITVGADERSDTGTLMQIGDGWVQVVKDNGELILVPSTAIRMVKLLDMTRATPVVERETGPYVSTSLREPAAQTLP